MDRKLTIHIGSPKTGSTAIQNFCAANEDCLRKRGICYPRHKRFHAVDNHLYFSHLVVDFAPPTGQKPLPANRHKTEKKIVSYLKRVIREAESCAEILLSGEEMFYARDVSVLKVLHDMFSSISIVAYLRRQDQFIQSYYLQYFKRGKVSAKLQDHEYLKNDFWLDYYGRVAEWAEIFGREKIVVRPFEKEQFYGSNLFADFLKNTFELELTDEFTVPERKKSNVRVDNDVYEAVRLVNSLGLPHRDIRWMLKRLQEFPSVSSSHHDLHRLLSPQECLDVINKFDPQNRLLAREYLGKEGGAFFLAPLPDPAVEWSPSSGLSTEKSMRIVLWLLADVHNRARLAFRLKRFRRRFFK